MKKRIYHRSGPPGPLKSNWPDLGIPLPDCRKKWEYIVLDADKQPRLRTKNRQQAYDYANLMRKSGKRASVYKWEPSEDVLHNVRAQERSDWRWDRGFGA